MDLTDQAEQVGAGSVESVSEVEQCVCNEHRCHLSPPRMVQTFEILDESEGRKCYRPVLISCIVLLVVIILLIIILRSIF